MANTATHAQQSTPDRPVKRPGTLGYWLAGLVLVVLGSLGGWLIYSGVCVLTRSRMVRMTVPGRMVMPAPREGTYRIYHEHRSVFDGRVYINDPALPQGLSIVVTDPDGEPVPLSSPHAEVTYNIGDDRQGRLVSSFEVRSPGEYVVEATYENAAPGAKIILGAGRMSVLGFIVWVFLGLAVAGTGVLAGGILLLITLIRRSRGETSPG